MPSDLINIGRTGVAASRAALELSAQNIANASNPDYVRRRINQSELVSTSRIGGAQNAKLNGVLIGDIERFGNEFAQRQVRVSASDLARTNAEIAGLRSAENAIEQSSLYEGLVDLEAAFTRLEGDPTDLALRTSAVETARQLAQTFQFADFALGNARDLVEAEVVGDVETINGSAQALAKINADLVGSREGTAGRAALLDARDAALRDIAEEVGIAVTFDEFGAAQVRIEGSGNPLLVDRATAGTITSTIASDGSLSLEIDGTVFTPMGGSLAGRGAALADIVGRQNELNDAAATTIARANAAQSSGVSLDGSPGNPLFSGTGASDITMVLSDGAGLALAPAGAPAGSRDAANLSNLVAAIGADDGPLVAVDRSLLSLSSRIAGLDTTREGLVRINASAQAALLSETGVDLDEEAANLVRLQQAFDANSRIIQVATQLFDTILELR